MFKIILKMSVLITLIGIVLAKIGTVPVEDTKPGGRPVPKTVSCFTNDGQVPMEGLVPNPYDCNTFYICAEVEPGYPEAQLMMCQNGFNGTALYYDFLNCYCEVEDIAVCYDIESAEHKQKFFSCATKLEDKDGNELKD